MGALLLRFPRLDRLATLNWSGFCADWFGMRIIFSQCPKNPPANFVGPMMQLLLPIEASCLLLHASKAYLNLKFSPTTA
jgi:hypothetical protein